jgi:hypothetical protein
MMRTMLALRRSGYGRETKRPAIGYGQRPEMVSLLGHICRVLKRQLLQMPFMVLVLKTLTKCRSTTFITPHTPLQ